MPWRRRIAAIAGLVFFAGQIVPAYATIDNTATATGTYGGTDYNSDPDTVNVPVQSGAPALTVAVSMGAPVDTTGDGVIGPGDKVTVTYTVTNSGNVTINNVVPVHTATTFNTVAGTGTLDGSFSPASANLAPAANQVFTADFTLSAADAYNAAGITGASGNAMEISAEATGTPASGSLGAVTPATAEVDIPANPKIQVAKAYAFTTDTDSDGNADAGDVVTYTYTVTNTGNVALANVHVDDVHEGSALAGGTVAGESQTSAGPVGSNTDAAANGSWDNLTAGSVITFTYVHTVTQTEVDGG